MYFTSRAKSVHTGCVVEIYTICGPRGNLGRHPTSEAGQALALMRGRSVGRSRLQATGYREQAEATAKATPKPTPKPTANLTADPRRAGTAGQVCADQESR